MLISSKQDMELQIIVDNNALGTQNKELANPSTINKANTSNLSKYKNHINTIVYFVAIIWLVCIICLLARKVNGYIVLKVIRDNKLNTPSEKWQRTLIKISAVIKLKKKVKILFSPFVNSPITFGFFKPVILFPLRLATGLSDDEIKNILTHELAHILRNDYLVNIFQIIMETLLFYHPGIWFISGKLHIQREIICDEIASSYCKEPKVYINSLIKLEELRLSESKLVMAVKRNNNELLTRIKWINNQDQKQNKGITILLILFLALVLLGAGLTFKLPVGNENIKSANLNNAIDNQFKPYQGSLVVYDLKKNTNFYYNDTIGKSRYPCYSTFKIASSLIALELGVAKNEYFTIKYDSLKYPLSPWMKDKEPQKYWFQDQNMETALKYSVNWFYRELNKKIGYDNMVEYLNHLEYGNRDISTGLGNFWIDGSLQISAKEQVEFLKMIYKNEAQKISQKTQNTLKYIMLNESTEQYKLYGKTGTGELANEKIIAWYIGFLETQENTFIFALNMFVDSYQDIENNKRQELIKQVFTQMGVIK